MDAIVFDIIDTPPERSKPTYTGRSQLRLYELVRPDGSIVIRHRATGAQALEANLRHVERETGYHWRPVETGRKEQRG